MPCMQRRTVAGTLRTMRTRSITETQLCALSGQCMTDGRRTIGSWTSCNLRASTTESLMIFGSRVRGFRATQDRSHGSLWIPCDTPELQGSLALEGSSGAILSWICVTPPEGAASVMPCLYAQQTSIAELRRRMYLCVMLDFTRRFNTAVLLRPSMNRHRRSMRESASHALSGWGSWTEFLNAKRISHGPERSGTLETEF